MELSKISRALQRVPHHGKVLGIKTCPLNCGSCISYLHQTVQMEQHGGLLSDNESFSGGFAEIERSPM